MTKEQLLAAIDDLLRRMPTTSAFEDMQHPGYADSAPYLGLLFTVLRRVQPHYHPRLEGIRTNIRRQFFSATAREQAWDLLHEARAELRAELGALTTVVPAGKPFDYFNEVRSAIATARDEVFFVDRYLDVEVVENYFPSVAPGCSVRLLGGPERMKTLVPACKLYAGQEGLTIQVRSSPQIHDRFLFVDRRLCYLSGASFKDGGKNAPTILSQVVDGFDALWFTYDNAWNAGTKHWPP